MQPPHNAQQLSPPDSHWGPPTHVAGKGWGCWVDRTGRSATVPARHLQKFQAHKDYSGTVAEASRQTDTENVLDPLHTANKEL